MTKMTTSAESIKAPEALPEGEYTVKLQGFKPKYSKDKGSINYNPMLEVQGFTTKDGKPRYIRFNLNSKAAWITTDFLHGFGFHWEDLGSGQIGFPGEFIGPEDKPENWQYKGPLLGRTAKVYVVIDGTYNALKFFVCAIPACNTKYPDVNHTKDLNKKKA